ncbi:MAG TPA: M28 family peptidase [Holophaga sp.]|nr:M28 family peptidase [Holophaga sp.]
MRRPGSLKPARWAALAALLLGGILGLLSLRPPRPAPVTAAGFSALRAKAHIDAIAQHPHPVWDQASLEPVRAYLRTSLEGLGLPVEVIRHEPVTDRQGHRYPLVNLAAAIPGRSGRSILLVAHYDSAPLPGGSLGAADDGFGVATLLELARLMARERNLENGVRFLFTDAEETGLLGAIAELKERPEAYRDVELVVNLEARGVRGPAVMFETGARNLEAIRLYRKAHRPFAYSFAVDVYRRMPNGTDLTVFLKKGYQGLNFAVLDDLAAYHMPLDAPGQISLASLQHYGEQVLPVVRAFATDPAFARPGALQARQDAVYFSWVPGVFLAWSKGLDRVLCWLVVAACLVFAATERGRGRLRLGAAFRWALVWLVLAFLALGAGLGTSWLAGKATGIRWRFAYMPGVPGETWITWALLLGLGALAFLLARRSRDRSPLGGALLLNLLWLALVAVKVPGGTFLVSVPLLAVLATQVAGRALRPLAVLGPVLIVSLYVPVLHLVGLALTFGALGLVLFVAAFPVVLAATALPETP